MSQNCGEPPSVRRARSFETLNPAGGGATHQVDDVVRMQKCHPLCHVQSNGCPPASPTRLSHRQCCLHTQKISEEADEEADKEAADKEGHTGCSRSSAACSRLLETSCLPSPRPHSRHSPYMTSRCEEQVFSGPHRQQDQEPTVAGGELKGTCEHVCVSGAAGGGWAHLRP